MERPQDRRPSKSGPSQQLPGSQPAAAASMFADVPLGKRVHSYIERSGLGMVLDVASAALSMLTVFTYMWETRYSEFDATWLALRAVDLVCSVLFAAEWCFWLWLSRNRPRFILSWQSLVDVVTIVPIFLSLFITRQVPGFAAFEALVRIFRVVRVFRVFRLGKRLKSEVQSRLLTLLFTLLAIIVTGAGMFYELETRFGDRYPDLTMEQAIYWSVVTTTTIGYGDLSPSITASQMTLLAMLLIAFTLLPYQTSTLVNALSETSVYQSARFSRAARGRHVLVTGHLSAATCSLITKELFHQDSGYSDFTLVFLSPAAPNDVMRRLLKTSRHSHRLLYIQGSWAVHEDLTRAAVDACEAAFILADKAPADARVADLSNIQACLALGFFMQRAERARRATGPKPLAQRLRELAWLSHTHKSKVSDGVPSVCIQLLLPESKQQLAHMLELYSKQGLLSTVSGVPQRDTSLQPSGKQSPAGQGASCFEAKFSATEAALDWLSACSGKAEPPAHAAAGPAAGGSSAAWWVCFRRHLTCICTTELRYGLLAQHALGCSGAVALLSNLVRSMDESVLLAAEFERLPEWAQEYLEGSSNEVYEVAALPAHFRGRTLSLVARYLLEVHRAVLLASTGTSSGGKYGRAADSHRTQQQPPEAAAAAGSRHSRGIQLLPATLGHTIKRHTTAFVITADARVVLDIVESSAAALKRFEGWLAAGGNDGSGEQLALVQCDAAVFASKTGAKHSMSYAQPALVARPGRLLSGAEVSAGAGIKQAAQLLLLPQPEAATDPPAAANSTAPTSLLPSPALTPRANGTVAADTISAASSRRMTADPGSAGSSFRRAGPAGLVGRHSAKLLAALPGGATTQDGSGAGSRQRRHRGSFQILSARGGVEGIEELLAGGTGSEEAASEPDVGGSPTRSACASSRRTTAASQRMLQQLQQLYHTRDAAMSTAECIQDMMCAEVDCQAHILVCGCDTPPAVLACLLRPLCSAAADALPGRRADVVVLNTLAPCVSTDWEAVARLASVRYVQGSVGDAGALACANAAAAASAVVLLAWCQADADDAAAAAMVDAAVIAAVRQLRAVNPSIKVCCELGQHESLAFLDPLGSLLDGCSADAAAVAVTTPPFMSGAVLVPSVLDSLTCQAVFTAAAPHILDRLLVQWHKHPGHDAGAVLLQVPVQQCPCDTFGQLFTWLLEHRSMLACGLYRQAEHEGRVLRFCYTNPHKDTRLQCTDKAFVLAPRGAASTPVV